MKDRKLETRENRLNRAKTQVEARLKSLNEKEKDPKSIEKDSVMRHLLAEVRKVRRSINSLQREPPKADKLAKKVVKPKAPKPPKEKKPKKKEEAPPA